MHISNNKDFCLYISKQKLNESNAHMITYGTLIQQINYI